VGLVGCGTIGSALARAIERQYADVARIVALSDVVQEDAVRLQRRLTSRPRIVSLPELIRTSHLVLEAASVSIADRVARLSLAAGRDVLIMSTGGLLEHPQRWQRLLRRSRGRLYVPSGGVCGLDGLKAMAVGRLRRIRLTTRKPPEAFAASPWIKTKRVPVHRFKTARVVFEGTPAQAVRAFPQNVNVAAALALFSSIATLFYYILLILMQSRE